MGVTVLCIVAALLFSQNLLDWADFLLESGRKLSEKRAKVASTCKVFAKRLQKAAGKRKWWKALSNKSIATAWKQLRGRPSDLESGDERRHTA